MKTVVKNNLMGVRGRVPCPFPSKGVRTHSQTRGKELQALATSPWSWQQALMWQAKPSSGSSWPAGAGPSCPAALRRHEWRGEAGLTASRLIRQWGITPALGEPRRSRQARRGSRTLGRRGVKSGPSRRDEGLGYCPRRSTLSLWSLRSGWTLGEHQDLGASELFQGGSFFPQCLT